SRERRGVRLPPPTHLVRGQDRLIANTVHNSSFWSGRRVPVLSPLAEMVNTSRGDNGACGIAAVAWCQAAGRAQLGGEAAARASAQARASAASSTAASAWSMAQAA